MGLLLEGLELMDDASTQPRLPFPLIERPAAVEYVGLEIECDCGFVTRLASAEANIAALEVHGAVCPSRFGEDGPAEPMSWPMALSRITFALSLLGMVWAIAWAMH